jgi:ubiquinone/menaquinone biosynthesis C-methylase UbiE
MASPRDRFEMCVAMAGSGDALLEVGAGSGNLALALRARFSRISVTELSTARASRLRGLGFEVHEGPIEHGLPVADGCFDAAIMNAVVEHLVCVEEALREVHRVLRSGGRLIVTTPNIAKWTRRIKLLAGRFPSTASKNEGLTTYGDRPTDLYDEGHLHYFTYRSLETVLRRAGFVLVQRFGYPGRLASVTPTLFSTDVCVVAQKRPSAQCEGGA